MKPVRLPASATNAFPRWALLVLCLLYILPGLIGRDPWKNIDAIGFGVMWTMAHGNFQDWLWPHIVGLPILQDGPLAFWLGALCIKLFGSLIGDPMAARVAVLFFFLVGTASVWSGAYLLGSRQQAQPLKLAFGGQPDASNFARMLADSALLIYLGCFGLLVHSHETSAHALYVSFIALFLYTFIKFLDVRSYVHAFNIGFVFVLLGLVHNWLVPSILFLGVLILVACKNWRVACCLLLALVPPVVVVVAIFFASAHYTPLFQSSLFDAWVVSTYPQFHIPTLVTLAYFLKNSVWFVWPAWPFACWAVYTWRKQYTQPHIALPLSFVVMLIGVTLFYSKSEAGVLLPLLPPFAILAAFGLPTMKRGAINAIDWFSVMVLSACAGFIWLGWIANQTGWPASIAKNSFKLMPGFVLDFNAFAFVVAFVATLLWVVLVHWRVSRYPSVLWRAVVLSTGGVILCWQLLMTLWLPWINYGKSYAGVANKIARQLPPTGHCVNTNVGAAQRASFAYFGKINFAPYYNFVCPYFLVQDNPNKKNDVQQFSSKQWVLLWEGRRPSDRDERFRLFKKRVP